MRFLFICLFVLLSLAACATAPVIGPHFTSLSAQPEDKANIYILRPHVDFGRAVWPNILFNKTKVAALPDSTYTMFRASPGAYSISTERTQLISGGWDIKGDIRVVAGKAYFLVLTRKTKEVSLLIPAGRGFFPVAATDVAWEGWVPLDPRDAPQALAELSFVQPTVESL